MTTRPEDSQTALGLAGASWTLALTLVAYGLAHLVPGLGATMSALLIGIVLRSGVGDIAPGLVSTTNLLLTVAVIFLGFSMQAAVLTELGPWTLVAMVLVVLVGLGSARLLSRSLGVDQETGWLIGIGSGICGSAAIAACAPLITRDNHKVVSALGSINLVGIFSLFAWSLIARALSVTDVDLSLLIGGTLQSLGHVAAVGDLLGDHVLDGALAVKMTRVFMLVPLVMVLGTRANDAASGRVSRVPVYVWGFLVSVLVANLPGLPPDALATGKLVGKVALVSAMLGIGYGIDVRMFFKQAPALLFLAAFISGVQLLILFGAIALW